MGNERVGRRLQRCLRSKVTGKVVVGKGRGLKLLGSKFGKVRPERA